MCNFRQEHNTDWIYREVGLTSLAAFALEIKEKCQRQVGHDRVQIEANEQLDMGRIDPTVAYVQITHVEPSPIPIGKEMWKCGKMGVFGLKNEIFRRIFSWKRGFSC